jgi:hypothetical protein
MNKEIRQLDDVMLAEMKSAKRTGLSFRELKNICKKAMPSLEVYNEQDLLGSRFIHEILSNIENLENSGRIKVTRRGKFILRIDLTDRGKELLKNTLFASKVV